MGFAPADKYALDVPDAIKVLVRAAGDDNFKLIRLLSVIVQYERTKDGAPQVYKCCFDES